MTSGAPLFTNDRAHVSSLLGMTAVLGWGVVSLGGNIQYSAYIQYIYPPISPYIPYKNSKVFSQRKGKI